jgi:hypothetical protein
MPICWRLVVTYDCKNVMAAREYVCLQCDVCSSAPWAFMIKSFPIVLLSLNISHRLNDVQDSISTTETERSFKLSGVFDFWTYPRNHKRHLICRGNYSNGKIILIWAWLSRKAVIEE